jgi:hypothetical protein
VKLKDFNRLKKFMQMTFSDADAEALMAVRQANALLKKDNIDWDRVLNKCVTLDVEEGDHGDDPPSQRPTRGGGHDPWANQIEAAFDAIWASEPKGSFRRFVIDVQKQWKEKGRLSENQRTAILDAARKARSGG